MRRIALVLLAAAAGACDREPARIPSVGTLERERIELAADSDEPILEVHVSEGDSVAPGDVILTQDPQRLEALLARARAERAVARAALAEAEHGPRRQAIERARARLEAAKSAVVTLRYELDREQALAGDNFVSRNRLDVLQGQYDQAVAQRAAAAAELDELREGTRQEVKDQARSALAAADAAVSELQIRLDRARITAPAAGTVEALPFEAGERPQPDETVAVLLREAPIYARVHVPEPLRTRLTPGAAAEVMVDGYASPFPGRLRWIAASATFTPYLSLTRHDRSRLSYLAEIDLEGEDAAALPVGVPVEVYFPDLGR